LHFFANEEEDNGNNQANEMCQALYEDAAAKCEVTHGMNSGFYDAVGYKNQVNQETLVWDFIEDAVTYGTFSSANDFNIYGRTDRSTGSSSCTSIGQKVALCI
jgi:hypothetical protein